MRTRPETNPHNPEDVILQSHALVDVRQTYTASYIFENFEIPDVVNYKFSKTADLLPG